jgi:hypothetical protein
LQQSEFLGWLLRDLQFIPPSRCIINYFIVPYYWKIKRTNKQMESMIHATINLLQVIFNKISITSTYKSSVIRVQVHSINNYFTLLLKHTRHLSNLQILIRYSSAYVVSSTRWPGCWLLCPNSVWIIIVGGVNQAKLSYFVLCLLFYVRTYILLCLPSPSI